MIDLKMENILLDMFKMDIDKNGKNTDISSIVVLTIKSLLPRGNGMGNKIDYRRFEEELKLWRSYAMGNDTSLAVIDGEINEDVYFNERDESIYLRIIPIVLANTKYDVIEEEIIKNILYTTGKIEILLEWLLIGRTLYLLLEKEEDIIEDIKTYLINISQVDFLEKYKSYYRFTIDQQMDKYKIEFERCRIGLLTLLNDVKIDKYRALQDLIFTKKEEMVETKFGKIVDASRKQQSYTNVDDFYLNMNKYLMRLRKGRIDPEALRIEDYRLPDIFSLEEGEVFFHSLLNDGKVIKKEVKNGIITSLIATKSGMYLLKRDPI